MATGGVFQLITNDGKQDRMLMATQMLRNRLEAIRAKRRADPAVADETPTLLDIERTHVLIVDWDSVSKRYASLSLRIEASASILLI